MRQKIIDAIMVHTATEYPRECCGVMVQKSRVQRYIPYRNPTIDSTEYFHLSPEDYAAAEDWGTAITVVYSYPDAATQVSELDRVQCDTTLPPWHIVSWPEGDLHTIQLRGKLPLLERPFVLGYFDYWGLVMSYFRQTHSIESTDYRVDYPWWEDSYPENFYHDCWYECGFRKFSGAPQSGDMVITQIQANKWNHAGTLPGGNMLFHRLYGHLSQRVPCGGYWQEWMMKVLRYKCLRQSSTLSKGDRDVKKNILLISLLGLFGCSASSLQEGQSIYSGHTSKSAAQLNRCMSPK